MNVLTISPIQASNNFSSEISQSNVELAPGLWEHTYQFQPNESVRKQTKQPAILFEWSFPYLDTSYIWTPTSGFNRSIPTDWHYPVKTMTSISAPMVCLYSEDAKNRYTCAISEIKEIVELSFGVHEEDGTMKCKIEIPMKDFTMQKPYTVKLLEDKREQPYHRAIEHVASWWETTCDITPMKVPQEARKPVYSTWYSYHQDLFEHEIEQECKLAYQMGFDSIIVDDGWQTFDNHRGYAFCGDWEVAKERFSDFPAHVKRVHEIGMKYIMWYSVPFVGYQSKMWEQFKDMILFDNQREKAGVLDPRYPQVREFLIQNYEHAIRDWDLDGLKLDFIDQIYFHEQSKEFDERMDYLSVQDALDRMMTDITTRLQAIKSDVMIEFRQRYIGPNMRKYGNMFRVADCPNSGISNRVGIADLRMLSGNTAVHSDMLMWHKDEKAEIAALQIIACIFSTIQISVKLGVIPEEQVQMLSFWMSFAKEHRELLLEQDFIPFEPQHLYPEVRAVQDTKAIIAIYAARRMVSITENLKEVILLNGTKEQEMYLEFDSKRRFVLVQKDCCGRECKTETVTFEKGIHRLPVTTSGLIYLTEDSSVD